MRQPFRAICAYCGAEFTSRNVRRLYCSTACRRDFQNDRRAAERAEIREAREREDWIDKPHWLQDPWQICEEDELDQWRTVWAQALLDPLPVEDDAPWERVSDPYTFKSSRRHKGQCALPGMEIMRPRP